MENEREKFFRQINLEGDKCVRSHISITHPVWQEYKEKLDWLEGFSPYVSVGIGRSNEVHVPLYAGSNRIRSNAPILQARND